MLGFGGIVGQLLSCEAAREFLERRARGAAVERHERHDEAGLDRLAIPGAVERDERALFELRGKRGPGVEHEPVRRPVRRERDERGLLADARTLRPAAV